MKILLASLALLALLLPALPMAQALQLGENLYISLPPETVQCIDILLPDSAGVFVPGLVDYELYSDTNWGDLTEQVVTTDENNTVKIPLCFSSFGRKEGDCSNTYSLSVSAPSLGAAKTFGGGACVSKFPDVDYAAPEEGESPMDVLNNNADIFAIAFKAPVQYAEPGEEKTFTLLLESYADITLDLSAKGLTPKLSEVSLSPENSKTSIDFKSAGAEEVSITAKIRNCEGSFCTKQAKGEVKPSGESPAGFSVNLFPVDLNVKNLDPVKYELIITNFGEEREFEIEFIYSEGMLTSFQDQALSFEGEKTIEFEITPKEESTLYQFTMFITSSGDTKYASATLTTNELLTDTMREAEHIKQENPEASEFVEAQLDSWYETYKSKEYGKELGDYTELKNNLESVKPAPEENQTHEPAEPIPEPEEENSAFLYILYTAAASVIVIAVLAIFFLRKKSRGKKEVEVAELEQGF